MSGGYEVVMWALLIISTTTDLIWGKIFNAVTLTSTAAGLLFRLVSGGLPEASVAAMAVGAALLLFFPLYLMRALTAGDVKLLMALGAWSNTLVVIRLGMISILIGGAVGLYLLLRTRGLKASLGSVAHHVKTPVIAVGSYRMPFAPAFLCGYLLLAISEMSRWSWL